MDKGDRKEIVSVLHGLTKEVSVLRTGVDDLVQDKDHDRLRSEALGLLGESRLPEAVISPLPSASLPTMTPWIDLVAKHERALEAHSVDPTSLDLESLLPADLSLAIDQAWKITPQREKWRWCEDFIAVGAAGLAGGALDLFTSGLIVVANQVDPNDVLAQGQREFKSRFGREIPNPMRRHPIDYKVPADLMAGRMQDMHRVAGPGHDLCRIREALDLMMGKLSDVSIAGQSVSERMQGLRLNGLKGDEAKLFNIFADKEQALFALLVHWFADFLSKRSLPIPGWSYAVDLGGSPARLATALYQSGGNLRNLMTGLGKLSGFVVTELMLRLHICIQRWRENEKQIFEWSDKRRYPEMFLVAHSVASGFGAAAATVAWNPVFLNAGAISMAAKNAVHLSIKVNSERKKCLDRFCELVADTRTGLDEMRVRAVAADLVNQT